jgi:predicted HTH transcriptional regulator
MSGDSMKLSKEELQQQRYIALVDDLCRLPSEMPWVEFKVNNSDPDRIARTVSALANAARLSDEPFGYMVWGIADGNHAVVGTDFEPGTKKKATSL